MSEYTPTTDQVRAVFIAAPGHHTHAGSRHEAFERWLASITPHTPTDDEREALLTEADALVASWDQKGSWSSDSPVGMVMRLAAALRHSEPQGEPSDAQVQGLITRAQSIVDSMKSSTGRRTRGDEWCYVRYGQVESLDVVLAALRAAGGAR